MAAPELIVADVTCSTSLVLFRLLQLNKIELKFLPSNPLCFENVDNLIPENSTELSEEKKQARLLETEQKEKAEVALQQISKDLRSRLRKVTRKLCILFNFSF